METLVENSSNQAFKTWLFVQAYSQEAPLGTLSKWHFTNAMFD